MTPRHVWRDPSLRPVVAASLTLSLAIGVFGVSFGVGAVSAGASVAQACVMSLLVFTGASQLSAVSVIAAGGTTASALGGALVLAARNGVYALTMGRRVRGRLPTRLVAAQLTIDESTAVGIAQETDPLARQGFWQTGLAVFVFWNLMTLAGALVGNTLGDPRTWGLDAAAAGAFCALLWPRLRRREAQATAVIAVVLTLVAMPHTPAGVPVLVAALAAAVVAGWPGARRTAAAPSSPEPPPAGNAATAEEDAR